MKIPHRTILVTIGAAGDEAPAKLTFNQLYCNESERILAALGQAKDLAGTPGEAKAASTAMIDYRTAILDKCISVENLEWENGDPITVEDVKAKRLPIDLIDRILAGYQAGIATSASEAEEKNADSPAEPLPG